MTQAALLHTLCAAGGGLLMGAALARAVAPRDYFDCAGSMAAPWLVFFNWPLLPPHMQLPAAVTLGGAFVGYNFMRHSPWCQ